LQGELEFHGLKNKVRVTSSEYIKPQCEKSSKCGKVMLGVPGTRIIEIEAL
jgi:hypothetical protein